ncbi:uncharacterized protein LOC101455613 [Ceratitis capitata]|uniref:(Mediterranean fruit fly) hypothetical protein n=1 Tax=Ceratitis capitata TaxID=7213 RepID=A0A811V0Y4_CERCA|nr:uncharacterized protein LOC101455613 [Ceratitis capitata]XP_020713867.1 uncharacterized protein LOC101455613 [Ceratitis capitata]CAD7004531.1 unnamed protein product [Ceratitis capitata]
MTRTSHKKNRPFDIKLISLVQPHPVLYHRHWGGLSTFECMKEKNRIWNMIASDLGTNPEFCLSRWNNLRNHFQRELRHCRDLCPKEGIIRGSTWPYLERMRFLEFTNIFDKPKKALNIKYGSKGSKNKLLETNERVFTGEADKSIEMSRLLDKTTSEALENETSTAFQISDKSSVHYSVENCGQIAYLLRKVRSERKAQIERRILAYLCKCQLRAITNKDISDIKV